jgi:hypothetical protein
MRKKAIYLSFIVSVALAVNIQAGIYSGGDGSVQNPFRIGTPQDLNDIHNHVEDYNKCFVLINDIDMSGYTYTTAVIAPDTNNIDDLNDITLPDTFDGPAFTGTFDGNNHAILSLLIDDSNVVFDQNTIGNDYLGLFGMLKDGGVRNLIIADFNISHANDWVDAEFHGGLCGFNYGGTINNCTVTGSVAGGSLNGGFVFGGLVRSELRYYHGLRIVLLSQRRRNNRGAVRIEYTQ